MAPSPPPIDKLHDLTGQVALVTGGARGIGAAICARLRQAGARVMIADQDVEQAEKTAREIDPGAESTGWTTVDTRHPEHADRAVEATLTVFEGLDILVNNAGIFPAGSTLETTEAEWDATLDINLKGAFFFARAAAAHMAGAGGGSIVNIASINARRPFAGLTPYGISKAGLEMLTRSLALELGPVGVRANAVAPGGIETPGGLEARRQMAALYGADEDQVRDGYCARVPLRRMGTADEVALAVLYLVSPAASYVTGSTLVVDGGFLVT